MLVVERCCRAAYRTISVVVLLNRVEKWLAGRGSRDVEFLFKDVKQQLSWKKAPRAMALANVADLYALFADVAPNAALPPIKLATALQAADKKGARELHLQAHRGMVRADGWSHPHDKF